MAEWKNKPLQGAPINWSHPLAKGLVGFWLMNEGGGNKIYDLSGNNNTGTLTNMAIPATATSGWNPSRTGMGLSFDGVNDYVNIPDTASLRPTTLTISAWVNPNSPGTYARILSKGLSVSERDYSIGKQDTKATFFFYNSTNAQVWTTTDTWASLFPSGSWNHLAVSYTQGSGASLRFYVNGVLKAGSWTVGTGNVNFEYDTNPLYIGTCFSTIVTEQFNGLIDDVRIFNRELSPQEVMESYINPLGIFRKNKLWLFKATEGSESVSPSVSESVSPSASGLPTYTLYRWDGGSWLKAKLEVYC